MQSVPTFSKFVRTTDSFVYNYSLKHKGGRVGGWWLYSYRLVTVLLRYVLNFVARRDNDVFYTKFLIEVKWHIHIRTKNNPSPLLVFLKGLRFSEA